MMATEERNSHDLVKLKKAPHHFIIKPQGSYPEEIYTCVYGQDCSVVCKGQGKSDNLKGHQKENGGVEMA